MSTSQRPSPRQEALAAILQTRDLLDAALLSADAWEKLITLAWDNRTHVGDRREIRRDVRGILLASARADRVS
ncbi:hypothetical protein GCM10027058_29360 [Microbacterium neimengense]